MNDLPSDDTVQGRMQGIRCDIDQGLKDVSASARSLVDWKHYVKTYPWVCLGTAAAVGFLIVPQRSTLIDADSANPRDAAKTEHLVVKTARAAARGLVDVLVATVTKKAVREATAYLDQSAGRSPGIANVAGGKPT
jgi:hypothetical protein